MAKCAGHCKEARACVHTVVAKDGVAVAAATGLVWVGARHAMPIHGLVSRAVFHVTSKGYVGCLCTAARKRQASAVQWQSAAPAALTVVKP